MEISNKILLISAGLLYYIVQTKQEQKHLSLEQELARLQDLTVQQGGDLKDYVEERTKSKDELIKESLKIEPTLEFGELNGAKWSVRMSWNIKNVSTQYVFVITGIKSVVSIDGYTSKFWMPGNVKNFLTLAPGDSGRIRSEAVTQLLYDDTGVRDRIIKKYNPFPIPNDFKLLSDPTGEFAWVSEWFNTLRIDTQVRVQSVYGDNTITSIEGLTGKIRKVYKKIAGRPNGDIWFNYAYPAGTMRPMDGENMQNKELK